MKKILKQQLKDLKGVGSTQAKRTRNRLNRVRRIR